ncbi:DNA-3-methyladenine glycosylase II [Arcicella aurantiaca]|uniref:DNA-3-methyladenine glycosylase II n=1 Tax=Arcicella aurantiaca TaxID=591202 RepID=A0A316EGR7_9BACT|nr:DNA glycosylase [Arcicella aurantiaca]PWK28664.1 DNA-3-methyladenine glycosylase II [Arcicella aurantiaca]
MTFSIPIPPNFSFQECLWFLDRNYDDCLHEIRESSVRKLILVQAIPILIDISEKEQNLIITILEGNPQQQIVIDFVKEWFDIERDLTDFYHLLHQDSDLNYMVTEYKGLRLLGIPDLFEALCWSIIGQQINLNFAYKLKRRFTEVYGTTFHFQNSVYYAFPSCEVVAKLKVEDLLPMQFSNRKAEYLIEIAKQFVDGNISKAKLSELSTDEALKKLIQVRGIGEWTANYALMKSLKRLECITYGDVGLYNALHCLKKFPKRPSRGEIESFFINFKNWEAYTVFYLWRSLAIPQ